MDLKSNVKRSSSHYEFRVSSIQITVGHPHQVYSFLNSQMVLWESSTMYNGLIPKPIFILTNTVHSF